MKKLIVLSVLLIVITSCGKKYNCKCVTTKKATGEVVTEEVISYRISTKRPEAQLAEDCKLLGPQKTTLRADTSSITNCNL
jgi:hypothetical protein